MLYRSLARVTPQAKEFTFEQVKQYCGAVQLDQRLAAARTGIMNSVRDEFLTSPGLPLNKHRRISRCDALHLFQNGP